MRTVKKVLKIKDALRKSMLSDCFGKDDAAPKIMRIVKDLCRNMVERR